MPIKSLLYFFPNKDQFISAMYIIIFYFLKISKTLKRGTNQSINISARDFLY